MNHLQAPPALTPQGTMPTEDQAAGSPGPKVPATPQEHLPPLLRRWPLPTSNGSFDAPAKPGVISSMSPVTSYHNGHRTSKTKAPRPGYFEDLPIRFKHVMLLAVSLASVSLFQTYLSHALYAEAMGLRPLEWLQRIPLPYLNFMTWALLCPAIYKGMRTWTRKRTGRAQKVAIHVLLALGISSIHELISTPLYYGILFVGGQFLPSEPAHMAWIWDSFGHAILFRFLEYWVVLGILIAFENARLRRVERTQMMNLRNELQTAQLNALRGQLQPHFLFNALNTVSTLMEDSVEEARNVLDQLGQLLRTSLNKDHRDRVSLAMEIDHVSNYLNIQAVRFRDKLRVQYRVAANCGEAMVPSMIIQPLVENSIKHSAVRAKQVLSIMIEAFLDHDRLVLRVLDNGTGCADLDQAMNGDGIGLRNVRERLQLQYGDSAHMSVTSNIGQGFQVTISLPFIPTKETAG